MEWNDELLDRLAVHVAFEVEMLVEQVSILVDAYGPSGPAGSMGNNPESQALLEASLVHIRLLDEFLGNKGSRDTDIRANYWVPGWVPHQWLAPSSREWINWRVTHLSALREAHDPWSICEYALACCAQLDEFFKSVGRRSQDRLDAFGDAPDQAQKGMTKFAVALKAT